MTSASSMTCGRRSTICHDCSLTRAETTIPSTGSLEERNLDSTVFNAMSGESDFAIRSLPSEWLKADGC